MDRPSWIDDVFVEGKGTQDKKKYYVAWIGSPFYFALDMKEAVQSGRLNTYSPFEEIGYPSQWDKEIWRFVNPVSESEIPGWGREHRNK